MVKDVQSLDIYLNQRKNKSEIDGANGQEKLESSRETRRCHGDNKRRLSREFFRLGTCREEVKPNLLALHYQYEGTPSLLILPTTRHDVPSVIVVMGYKDVVV